VWRVQVDGSGLTRLTPPDFDAYTPAASADGKRLALAIHRKLHRQVAVMDLASGSLTELTDGSTDFWNPTIAPDGRFVVYHRVSPDVVTPNAEAWGAPPGTALRLLRLDGAFPSFAPDGRRIAFCDAAMARLDVVNLDGSARKTLHQGSTRALFSTSWAHHGDRIAFALGPVFEGPGAKVDIASVRPDGSGFAQFVRDPGNDAFPSFSPDGTELVFRSGRGGTKNLYIMKADGSYLRRLTDGKWTDTMCDWSPAGEWITFASDRGGDFEIWLVKPDGTGLRKVVKGGGRNNHPHFSPDGRWIVFTSKRAGFSTEEVSSTGQPQPYGDLFIVRSDGTGMLRLTHNGFEEGTPAWGPAVTSGTSREGSRGNSADY
jgi:Tol biopolymer transport system component